MNKKERYSCSQALAHPWFSEILKDGARPKPLNENVLQSLDDYKGVSHLKKEALNVLVKMLPDDEIQHLRETFQALDQDKTGMITPDELEEAFRQVTGGEASPSSQQIKKIITQVDYKGNGKINYTDFLAATVSVKKVLTKQKLYALFKHFDTDDSEYITPANIREAFAVNGK